MKIRYVGPYASVHVPALGVVVERGEQIDVEEGTAESLCEQATWENASVHVPALGVVVERGEQIDVEEGTAESLCEQATLGEVPTRSNEGTKE